MSTPIKRLEIIKNAIELEDDDIIRSQLKRLKEERFDDELLSIVAALERKLHRSPSRHHHGCKASAPLPVARSAPAASAGAESPKSVCAI